jgi:hypothetical protein
MFCWVFLPSLLPTLLLDKASSVPINLNLERVRDMRSTVLPEILRVLLPAGTNRVLDTLAAKEHTTRAEWVRRNLVLPTVKANGVPAPQKDVAA